MMKQREGGEWMSVVEADTSDANSQGADPGCLHDIQI
jgi:hypothetical protein